ncbi:hypothetical protein SSPS47_35225 (plasmid) [Streptomyces sp. S4.7]|nr:hypothetical protein SSPS47_35225 [Streptomyces sp. S4.7]
MASTRIEMTTATSTTSGRIGADHSQPVGVDASTSGVTVKTLNRMTPKTITHDRRSTFSAWSTWD